MTQQRGGSAGFFAVLLGRNPNGTDQTPGHTDTLSRTSNPLNNQLAAGPTAGNKTLAAYKAYPPPRVSGQTAFEAALRNASQEDERTGNADVHSKARHANGNLYTALPRQPETEAARPSRKVAFNTPSSSIRRLKYAADSSTDVRDHASVTRQTQKPRSTTEERPAVQPTGPTSRVPVRAERQDQRYTAQFSSKPNGSSKVNGNAAHEKTEPARHTREKEAARPRDVTRIQSREATRVQPAPAPDRPRPPAIGPQPKQKDAFDPPVRRPVPSFLPPVASTAGRFDSIDEPKTRVRSQDKLDRETPRGSGEQMRRSKDAGEPRTNKEKTSGSRPGPSPTKRTKEHYKPGQEALDGMQRQRISSSRPAHLYNNLSRNPLSAEHDHRPVVSRGRG